MPAKTSPDYLYLLDNYYAVKFKYHMVTAMTLFQSLPRELKKFRFNFREEGENTAGKFRMDSGIMEEFFPIEIALARQAGLNLKDYVLIKKII